MTKLSREQISQCKAEQSLPLWILDVVFDQVEFHVTWAGVTVEPRSGGHTLLSIRNVSNAASHKLGHDDLNSAMQSKWLLIIAILEAIVSVASEIDATAGMSEKTIISAG